MPRSNTLGSQVQSAYTRSDRYLDRHHTVDYPAEHLPDHHHIPDRHLTCESPTAGLLGKHRSKRAHGYHSLHTSPHKTPSAVCNAEVCRGTCTARDPTTCDEYNCKSAVCQHHRHAERHTSPKRLSPSKHVHHGVQHSPHYPTTGPHDHHHSVTCPAASSSLPCSTTCTGPMSTIAQQQQTFNAFTKQQEKLLEQQEMLVSGMKKIQKKKIRKFHETYSPTTSSSSNQLSPVDIGPLVDSICAPLEKEVKKQEAQLAQLSEYRRAQFRRQEEEAYVGVKSGTIAGMLDDFNKQMEQLKVRESAVRRETDEKLREEKLRDEAKKKEEKGRRYSLDSKMVTEYSPPRTKIENKKLPTVSETERLSSEIERNQTAIIKLLNARNAQSLLPSFTETTTTLTTTTATGSKSTLAVQPIKKTLEKIVSPMIDKTIDKTMHQQQLLITQQQQLIALQKEQNKLQQQLQGKLASLRFELLSWRLEFLVTLIRII